MREGYRRCCTNDRWISWNIDACSNLWRCFEWSPHLWCLFWSRSDGRVFNLSRERCCVQWRVTKMNGCVMMSGGLVQSDWDRWVAATICLKCMYTVHIQALSVKKQESSILVSKQHVANFRKNVRWGWLAQIRLKVYTTNRLFLTNLHKNVISILFVGCWLVNSGYIHTLASEYNHLTDKTIGLNTLRKYEKLVTFIYCLLNSVANHDNR